MKWGCFVKKWKMGGVFCKKVDLSSTQGALCTVSVFFYFTFYLFGGGYAPNAPPAYGPVIVIWQLEGWITVRQIIKKDKMLG